MSEEEELGMRESCMGKVFNFKTDAIAGGRILPAPPMNAPDRFELFVLPDGVKKYASTFNSSPSLLVI